MIFRVHSWFHKFFLHIYGASRSTDRNPKPVMSQPFRLPCTVDPFPGRCPGLICVPLSGPPIFSSIHFGLVIEILCTKLTKDLHPFILDSKGCALLYNAIRITHAKLPNAKYTMTIIITSATFVKRDLKTLRTIQYTHPQRLHPPQSAIRGASRALRGPSRGWPALKSWANRIDARF